MGQGRKPTPTALRILQGNRQKRPLPKGEPQPMQMLPLPPSSLTGLALEEWNRLAPELHRIGVLTMVDRAALLKYCRFYARSEEAEEAAKELVTETPNGFVVQNPYIGIANRAAELMHKYMVELGLTPASRVKLAKGEVSVDDPLEQFLKAGKRKPRQA